MRPMQDMEDYSIRATDGIIGLVKDYSATMRRAAHSHQLHLQGGSQLQATCIAPALTLESF